MNRDAETVPARHETPDVAELRRLAEAATPGPWEAFGAVDGRRGERWLGVTTDMRATESARAGDVFAAQDCTRQDALFIAAANPAAVLGLLDHLAHMREARDNARAEVERLTAKVERVRELHKSSGDAETQGYTGLGYGYISPYCMGEVASDEYGVPWPCETIRDLDEEPQP